MNRAFLFAIVPCAAFTLSACAPDITKNETSPGARAIFDDTTGTIPLPSDLLKGADGKLALPILESDSELTKQIKAGLNDVDGWLTGSTITLPFDAPLDPATVTPESVLLVDMGDAYAPPTATLFTDAKLPQDEPQYFTLFNVGREPATAPPYNVIVKTKAPGPIQSAVEFKQGRRYAVVVTDTVKGTDGLPAISHPVFDFLKSSTPLVDENGHSRIILPDSQAALLEMGRSGVIAPVFDALEAKGILNREHALAYSVFSTQSGARPGFTPLAIGRVMPSPLDTWDANGVLKPVGAALDSVPEAVFDLPYDESTATAGAHLFKLGAQATPVAFTAQTSSTPDDKGFYSLKVAPNAALEPSTTYAVVLTKAIKSQGANGMPAQPSVYFTLARATTPLLDNSTKPAGINSPLIDLTLDVMILFGKDPATATPKDWTDEYALLVSNLATIESLRVAYSPFFEAVEAAGVPRADTIALWTFTTAAQ